MAKIRLKSVNWEHGMLLTPDHFLRQEQYLESLLFWNIGYLTTGSGLVGGGVRLPGGHARSGLSAGRRGRVCARGR